MPPAPERTCTSQFRASVNKRRGLALQSYEDLYEWSIKDIGAFWSDVWDETGVLGQKGAHVVDADGPLGRNPEWFGEARVNWAENMLRYRDGRVAIVEAGEFYGWIFGRWWDL